MKYINQLDYPHWLYVTRTDMDEEKRNWGKTSTVKSSGCGMCSAVMVADQLLPNCDFELSDAISLSYEVKANHQRGTDYSRFAPAFAEKLGLRLETSFDVEDVTRCIHTGGAVVVLVGAHREDQGLFTRGGHYMAIINQEADGRFVILDPSLSPTKYEEPDRKGKVEVRNGVIVLCDPKTLANEAVANGKVPYYLFWRK